MVSKKLVLISGHNSIVPYMDLHLHAQLEAMVYHSNKTWFTIITIITFNAHLLLGSYGLDRCCTENCYKMKLQHSDISLSTQHVGLPFPELRTTNLLHLISHREGEKDVYAWIIPNNQLLWIYNVKACP